MAALLLVLCLHAPETRRQWSKGYGVGMWIPETWKVVERDAGKRIFVIDGPRLGAGIPRAVLTFAGGAAGTTLESVAARFEKQVGQRPGWKVMARVRKRIGPFPCVRIGLVLQLKSGAKGRARFTVALLGDRYFVLELSAAASHFPGSTFDQIEKSLTVRWADHDLPGGMTATVPAGWAARVEGARLIVAGPVLRATVVLVREEDPQRPPDAKPGSKLRFLGKRRDTLTARKGKGADAERMVWVHADGWTGVAILPASSWEDLFPTAEAILAGLKKKKKKK